MPRYAKKTSVPVERSHAELKKVLAAYGGDEIVIVDSQRRGKSMVQFLYHELPIRLVVDMPARSEKRFHEKADGSRYSETQGTNSWKQACRQQWRILVLLIKAKLEAIDAKVLKAEEAFLPWLLLPNGKTVIEEVTPRLDKLLDSGELPKLLMEGG